ncbi:MAG TPA: hypothetical protein PLO62_02860 [Candidatus Hydrogenedentes bacterium]|nr:hypothetical protein [Candidatus Hydrogenedentota bacterium]HOS02164.1 hypothetical protein [Candidatus Hydrogenedentota bacterium]
MNSCGPFAVWIRRLLYLAVAASALLLGASGAYALFSDSGLRGYLLMAHTSLGGLFAVTLALFAVCYGERFRLVPDTPVHVGQRICFWLFLVLGATSALSVSLCMLPLAGTHGQHLLVATHRYCGYGIALTGLAHLYFVVSSKKTSCNA